MGRIAQRALFFIGWVLSPFTVWNDAFVNIPLAYLAANIAIRIYPFDFLTAVLVSYWGTNVLGVWIMYASGKKIFSEGKSIEREMVTLVVTVLFYSILVIILGRLGIIKPL